MLSYEFYKVLHVYSVLAVVIGVTLSFFTEASKKVKIINGIASFLILVAGMGLLARIGIKHGAGFPGWVIAKMILWLILAVGGPVLAKRLVEKRQIGYGALMVVVALAVFTAVYKPF